LHGKPLAATPKTSALTVYSVVRAILTRKLKLLIGCQSGKGQTAWINRVHPLAAARSKRMEKTC